MSLNDLVVLNPDSIFARAFVHWQEHGALPNDLTGDLLREMKDGMPHDVPSAFKDLVAADCSVA